MTAPRAIFFGSPAFAVPILDALYEVADVAVVVTQPDRPKGRGMKLQPPPVKQRAEQRGTEVWQPTKVRTEDFAARLRAVEADVGVVAAYGRILPGSVLEAPRLGCVNIHGSILPRWRGAAPIQWAVVHGDETTGVCLMQMDEGMDTGAVISCESTPIGEDETAGELSERLSALGAELVRRDLPRFVEGELQPEPQPEQGVTMAPILKKEHGRIDWTSSARAVHDHVRGMSPWPGAFTSMGGKRLKVHRTHVVSDDEAPEAQPGTVVRASGGELHVACGRGIVALDELQLEGKKRLPAKQVLAGGAFEPGLRLDEER